MAAADGDGSHGAEGAVFRIETAHFAGLIAANRVSGPIYVTVGADNPGYGTGSAGAARRVRAMAGAALLTALNRLAHWIEALGVRIGAHDGHDRAPVCDGRLASPVDGPVPQ
jgi:hypothetical protein